MPTDPLTMTVLDLDSALGGNADLLLAGGFGLYLKQLHLESTKARTLLPASRWPRARTTEDIDIFLRAEIVADASQMAHYRAALDRLEFKVDAEAKWLKFRRSVKGQNVVVDLMVGPMGDLEDATERNAIRVKPRGSSGLHARATDDALGVEHEPLRIPIAGTRSDDVGHSCDVLVASAFPFALMKLGALRDRINDTNKDEGRHHALDLYRIMAMLTESEDAVAVELAARFAGHAAIAQADQIINEYWIPTIGMGRIRLREHPLCPKDADTQWLATELRRLLLPLLNQS